MVSDCQTLSALDLEAALSILARTWAKKCLLETGQAFEDR